MNEKIDKLNIENKKLKDSISNYWENELNSQVIVGIPDKKIQKVGKKNNIQFIFHRFGETPNYEVFKIDAAKQTKIGNGNWTRFNYEFIPKSTNDTMVKLNFKMSFDGKTIERPARAILDVEN